MTTDQSKLSDRAASAVDTSRVERGVARIDNLLRGIEQSMPTPTDIQAQQGEQVESADNTQAASSDEQANGTADIQAANTNEQAKSTLDAQTASSDEQAKGTADTQADGTIELSWQEQQKHHINKIEAGLIALPLLFSAASSEAAIQELKREVQPYQPEAVQVIEAQQCDLRKAPTEVAKPAEVEPEIETLSDANDLGRQRRIDEDEAGRTEEPTIAASDGPPDGDPLANPKGSKL